MFQRLESMKKHAFGLMYIFGKDYDQLVAGIWLGRGGGNFFYVSFQYFFGSVVSVIGKSRILRKFLPQIYYKSINTHAL